MSPQALVPFAIQLQQRPAGGLAKQKTDFPIEHARRQHSRWQQRALAAGLVHFEAHSECLSIAAGLYLC